MKMATAPDSCPKCGSSYYWEKIDNTHEGYSLTKGIVGTVLLGPAGLLAGAIGKSKEVWLCKKCGFMQTYNKYF